MNVGGKIHLESCDGKWGGFYRERQTVKRNVSNVLDSYDEYCKNVMYDEIEIGHRVITMTLTAMSDNHVRFGLQNFSTFS